MTDPRRFADAVFHNARSRRSVRMPHAPPVLGKPSTRRISPTPPSPPEAEAGLETGEPAVFDAFTADLGVGLPTGTALLVVIPVEQGGAEGFRLRAVCCCGPLVEFADVYGRPDLALGSLVAADGLLPADVLSSMRTWSRTKKRLVRWLDARRAAHGDELQLVIWDQTGYGIPWELFWLERAPGSGRTEGWLGGLVTVTRWMSIETAWGETVRDYRSEHTCAGPVAAYVAADMEHDLSLLGPYHFESSDSLPRLAKALEDGDPLAMVYVACHGTYGTRLSDCVLGGVPLDRFDPRRFDRLGPAATFVFLNACHSGSLVDDAGRFRDRALRGFAEVFLRSGAAGVLATSGRVGDRQAHEMAGQLFRHLRDHPGRSVAEAVRDLRAEMARLTPDDLLDVDGPEGNRRLLPLLYRFMYVFYGSPRTAVSLATAEGV
ncbi:CHAT domain-containing protein [Actinomadura sp. HBU206391]|uniref:CHAT domain-containing protein n=1 Tax=Actinomadura sp. HBU206391 TaxID=2731692 RepID=UPI00164F9BEC|nr:CHAT domain-containing protein [Actinomadura sp. HBU206391]MBC6461076.1 CHAT domain-containing protein [Actinomadura sp. HBU206391]